MCVSNTINDCDITVDSRYCNDIVYWGTIGIAVVIGFDF